MNPTTPLGTRARGGRLALIGCAVAFSAGIASWCSLEGGDSRAHERAPEQLRAEPNTRQSQVAPRGDEIVLGMSAPFTGASRALGIELYRGARAYFDHINARGGVHGRKVVIRAYDDGYNPGPAIDNTVRLIDEDGVLLLFGYVGTPTTTRCLPILKRDRDRSVFLFCPFTGAQPQRQPPYDEFVFNLRASYYDETASLVNQFVQIGRTRIAVFYQIDAYGRNGWEGVRAALDRHGLKMAGEATYRRGTPFEASLNEQVQILRAADPDAVICVGSYEPCAAFVRDARDSGWTVPIANLSFVGGAHLVAKLETLGRPGGLDYSHGLINSQVVPSFDDLTLPAVREYRELMVRHRPELPAHLLTEPYTSFPHCFSGFEGFINAKLLVAVLEKMGAPFERARIRAAAESVRDLDLGTGVPVSFGPHRHQGSNRVYHTVVRGGRFEPLTSWEEWRK